MKYLFPEVFLFHSSPTLHSLYPKGYLNSRGYESRYNGNDLWCIISLGNMWRCARILPPGLCHCQGQRILNPIRLQFWKQFFFFFYFDIFREDARNIYIICPELPINLQRRVRLSWPLKSHQFSLNNMELLWSFTNSHLILRGNVWRAVGRICMWILGLKGLIYYWPISQA